MAGGGKVNELLQLASRGSPLPCMSVDGAGVGGKPGDGMPAWKALLLQIGCLVACVVLISRKWRFY